MAQYWTCRFGANHDFGEKCDCEESRMEEKLLKKGFWEKRLEISPESGQITFKFENEMAKVV